MISTAPATGNLTTARALAVLVALVTAILFPGTAVQDPEFDRASILGLHPQLPMAVIVLLAAAALAIRADRQR